VNGTVTKARACAGKRRHSSREAAQTHLYRLVDRGASPVGLNVYECPIRRHGETRHWHVGHRPGKHEEALT
jgi:hypothetical protein